MLVIVVIIVCVQDVIVWRRIDDHIVFEVDHVVDNVYDEMMNVDDEMVVIDNNHDLEAVDVCTHDLLRPSIM